jgi:hypothetical protein
MIVIDIYSVRLNVDYWKKPEEFHETQQIGLENMSLNDFCQKYIQLESKDSVATRLLAIVKRIFG